MSVSSVIVYWSCVVHGRGCNPHRSTSTFANVEITSSMMS